MSTDRYTSPLSERKSTFRTLCKQGDAVYFFTGQKVPYLEKIMDCIS